MISEYFLLRYLAPRIRPSPVAFASRRSFFREGVFFARCSSTTTMTVPARRTRLDLFGEIYNASSPLPATALIEVFPVDGQSGVLFSLGLKLLFRFGRK